MIVSGGFDPLDLSPVLWLDATDQDTVTLSDATHVEGWDDKSGNNNDFTQTTLAQQPVYDGSTKLTFDSGDILDLASALDIGDDVEIIVVANHTSFNVINVMVGYDNNNPNVDESRITLNETNLSTVDRVSSVLTVSKYTSTYTTGLNIYGQNKTQSYINENVYANTEANLGGFRINRIGGQYLSGVVQTNRGMIGDIQEVFIFNGNLTTGQRSSIVSYLKTKHSI